MSRTFGVVEEASHAVEVFDCLGACAFTQVCHSRQTTCAGEAVVGLVVRMLTDGYKNEFECTHLDTCLVW